MPDHIPLKKLEEILRRETALVFPGHVDQLLRVIAKEAADPEINPEPDKLFAVLNRAGENVLGGRTVEADSALLTKRFIPRAGQPQISQLGVDDVLHGTISSPLGPEDHIVKRVR